LATIISNDDACEAVYDAAERYVLSRVNARDLLEMDLCVRIEDGELFVELFLVTSTEDDDDALAKSAVDAAMKEGDRLMAGG